MEKCRILSAEFNKIDDIDGILDNLVDQYLFAEGLDPESLALTTKEQILTKYIQKFRETYEIEEGVNTAELLRNYIQEVFYNSYDPISELIIPSVEEIQQALTSDTSFTDNKILEKDDNQTSRIEVDNEGQIIRKHLADRFMTEAFHGLDKVKKYAENYGIYGVLSAAVIDRKNGRAITNNQDINANLKKFQEELFSNILKYAKEFGETPTITTLYDADGNPTRALNQLSGFITSTLTPEIFSKNALNSQYSQVILNDQPNIKKTAFNAYVSYVLLNNFDAFLQSYFGKNIEINEKYFGRRTKENKYRLGSKGTNMNQTWRTNSEIFVVDEIDGLTKNLINTTPRYAYNSNTPLVNSYITYQQFLTQICNIKEAMNSLVSDREIDSKNSTAINGEKQFIWKLSPDVRNFVNGRTVKDLIALTSSSQSKMAWISLFEILSNSNNPRLEIFKNLSKEDLAIIQSIYKGIFDRSNPKSIISLSENNKTVKNYFNYILQNATSVFPVKFIQYFKNGDETYVRNIQDQVQSRARRNLENAINTRNSKISLSLSEENPDEYLAKVFSVKSTNKQGVAQEIYINPPYVEFIENTNPYRGSVYVHGNQDVTAPNFSIPEGEDPNYHYNNLKTLFSEILTINLNDPQFEQALFAQYQNSNGQVNYVNLVSDLYNMTMRVLANQYISNVELKGLTSKSNILSKLRALFPTNPPRPNEALGEIPLFSTKDYNTLEKLSIAYVNARLNASHIQVIDGEGNASSTNTLSNLQSNYAVQFVEQIKNKSLAAAKNFSVLNDGFVTLYRQKELYNGETNSTKQTTDFNSAEFVQTQLVQNFLDGLVDYNSRNERVSDSIYPIKNGKIGILPSVNSDKSFIGLLLANLNQLIDPYIEDSPTWLEALNSSDFDTIMNQVIKNELGTFFSTAVQNINNEWERALKVAGIPITEFTGIHDFSSINQWAEQNGINNIVDYILNAVRTYNATNEGRVHPIQLIDQVHYVNNKGKLAVNMSLLSQLYIHNESGENGNLPLFDEFIKTKESQLLKDLIKGKVSIYTAQLTPQQFAAYEKVRGNEKGWEQNGEMIFAKFKVGNKEYTINKPRDIQKISRDLNTDFTHSIDKLRNYGELTINPFLHKYNILDYIITTEWNYATVGSYYAHPSKTKLSRESFFVEDMMNGYPAQVEWDNASRVDASFKRNVAYTAAMHIFQLGTVEGIPDTYNVAVIEDLTTTKYNITGDISEIEPTDGGMFVNPFIVYLENNSLEGERVGINKKQFCHAYSANTGTQVIIKTAGFGITNETMRMSEFDRSLMYKMTKGTWISSVGLPLTLDILKVPFVNQSSSDGEYYFKQDGKYYKLRLDLCESLGDNKYTRVLEEVKSDGTPTGKLEEPKVVTINSNYSLHNFFGGYNSMSLQNNKLQWSESSIEAVVSAMISVGTDSRGNQKVAQEGDYQPLKHSDIHYACGAGAVKCGAANINHKDAFDVDDPNFDINQDLNFMRIRLNQTGVQLDKEHQATGEDLSLMTQVVSACISRGYTLQEAIEMYEGLAQLSRQETKEFTEATTRNDLERVIVQTILNQASKSSINNSTLENLIQPLLKKQELGQQVTLQDIQDLKIPYSDNSVYNKIISMCSVELTRKGIRAKIDGLLAVLCPSHNRIKLYGGRLQNSWDNTDKLPVDESGNPITLDYVQMHTPPIKSPADLEMGRTYNIRYKDGHSEQFTINLPSQYWTLKRIISSGEVQTIVENVKVGRNLGSYNCRFLGEKGTKWQLYDLASTMNLFLVKELRDWAKNPSKLDLNDPEVQIKLEDARRIYESFTGTKSSRPLSEFLTTFDKTSGVGLQGFLNWFNGEDIPIKLRRQVQKDLESIRNGGTVQIYGSTGVVKVQPGTMETQNYEAALPKKFAEEFGLEVNDDLKTISEDTNFFTNRIIQKLQLNQGIIPQNYDVSLKRINGKHIYVLDKNNLPNTIGLERKENVHTITDSSGNIIRVDSNSKEIYSMSSNQDVIYVDASGNEIIVTDNVKYYIDNLQYVNVEFSGNNIKTNVSYLKDSENLTASNLYGYYVAEDEELETLNEESLLQISKDLNSPEKLASSSAFRYIQKLGREIHTSFLRSLDIIAARIPAQSMQSFMAMKIAAFIESDINTAYVSTDQIWLQGSDFDIDAVSLAMFSINSMGKYATWSPYMDLSSIEQLKKSEDLPLPTGVECTVKSGENGIDITPYIGTLFRINDFEKLQKDGKIKRTQGDKVQLIPSAISELNQFLRLINEQGAEIQINWGNLKKQDKLSKSLQEIINKHNLFLTKLKSKAARDNAVKNFNMSRMYKIADNPVNLIEASQSVDNTTGEPKAIANSSPIALEQRTHTYGNFINKALAIIENQVGKKCVGIAANGLKAFFALTEYCNMVLNDPNISEQEKINRLAFSKIFNLPTSDGRTKQIRKSLLANINGQATTSRLKAALNSVDQDTDAAIILSALLSLATDNAKELSLAKLNAGVNMLGTYVYGIIIGMNFKDVSTIMMSEPALLVRDLMEGNSLGVDLKMNRVDQVFDYLELGPRSQLKALDGRISTKENSRYISDIVFEAIKKEFGVLTYHGGPNEMSNDNYLQVLASSSENRNNLIEKLETIKTNLYNSHRDDDLRWKLVRYMDFLQGYVESVDIMKRNESMYNQFKTLALGAMEIRTLGQLLSLNQGIPSGTVDLVSKISSIEEIITNQARIRHKEAARKTFKDQQERTKSFNDDFSFSLIEFVNDEKYRKDQIAKYAKEGKNTFNILDVISTNPQYFEYLSRLADSYKMASVSVRTRASKIGTSIAIKEQHAYSGKDIQDITKRVDRIISDILIDYWLASNPDYGKFVLPRGQYLYTVNKNNQRVRAKDTIKTDKTIDLATKDGQATFCAYMETCVIPRVLRGLNKSMKKDQNFAKNKFLQNLKPMAFNQLYEDLRTTVLYSLPINMLPRTPEERATFEDLKEDFDKLRGEQYKFGKYNLYNLFYLYNLLAFHNIRGEGTLSSLFDQTDADIDRAKRTFINDFDLTKDLIFQGATKGADANKCDISTNFLIENTRLRRSPYSTTLKFIYASNPNNFGYSRWNMMEAQDEDENYVELDDEMGYNSNVRGNFELASNSQINRDKEQNFSTKKYRVYHKNGQITKVTNKSGKDLKVSGVQLYIENRLENNKLNSYYNLDKIEEQIDQALNCRKTK